MNIHQILTESHNRYLYEGLDKSEKQSVMLWESAGYAIKEAALTADQIQQLFTSIEQGAASGGSNRTMLGKGKDAASAVNKAWEDLKTKIQDSGPIKAADQKYDDAVAKIEAGLGGPNNKVNQAIQKYRAFAKAHPIAQGFIYSALIAAAGISGAGLGGAAVLGLLKMTDKLLQGEKFSSAAYQGAKTGAMAYGASKIADLFKGGAPAPDAATSGIEQGLSPRQVDELHKLGASGGKMVIKGESLWVEKPDGGLIMLKAPDGVEVEDMLKVAKSAAKSTASDAASNAAEKLSNSQMSAIEKAVADGKKLSPSLQASYDATKAAGNNFTGMMVANQPVIPGQPLTDLQVAAVDMAKSMGNKINPTVQAAYDAAKEAAVGDAGNRFGAAKSGWYDSIDFSSRNQLSEGLVYLVFNRVCAAQLDEGVMDKVKGAVGKLANKAADVGHNLTNKVTANKLNKAWQAAGAPTDSEELAAFLKTQGVDDQIIDQTFKSLKIKLAGAQTMYAQVKADLAKLDSKGKKRLTAYLQKQLGTV